MDDVDHLLCENVAKDDFKWPPNKPFHDWCIPAFLSANHFHCINDGIRIFRDKFAFL